MFCLRLIFEIFLYILCSIAIFVTPFIFAPFLLYRYFICALASCLNPQGLGSMVTPDSSLVAALSDAQTVIFPFVYQGIPDIKKIRKHFDQDIIKAKNSSGEFLYPELKQSIVSWGGFYFWKSCKKFKLENQIYELNPGKIDLDSKEGINFLEKLFKKKWSWGKHPIWELIVLPEVVVKGDESKENHFALLLFYHSALGDVTSLQKMFNKVYTPSLEQYLKKPQEYAKCFVKLDWKLCLQLPLDLARHILHAYLDTSNADLLPKRTPITNELALFTHSEPLHLSDLKQVAKMHKVSITSVVVAMTSAGLRTAAELCNGKIPDAIAQYAVPLMNHPEELRNYVGTSCIILPLKEDDAINRLKIVHKSLEAGKNSTLPLVFTTFFDLLGSLPHWLLSPIMKQGVKESVFTLTNLAWSPVPVCGWGGVYPLKQVKSIPVGSPGSKTVSFVLITCGNDARLSFSADRGLVSEKLGNAMMKSALDEIKVLMSDQ